MVNFAAITPTAGTDGLAYATAAALTGTEADVFNATGLRNYDPTPPLYEQAIAAVVQLAVSGAPASNTTFVVLQTDMGDGVWVDVAWALWTGTTGTALFLLQGGANGCGATQQTRAAGTAPASTGSNQASLGARFRFVGKAALAGGTAPAVTATVRYKLFDNPGSVSSGGAGGSVAVTSTTLPTGGTPKAGSLSATTTAAPLGSQACKAVVLQNLITNASDVLVGDATAQPFRLTPGQGLTLPVSDVGLVYAAMVSGTGTVPWISVN